MKPKRVLARGVSKRNLELTEMNADKKRLLNQRTKRDNGSSEPNTQNPPGWQEAEVTALARKKSGKKQRIGTFGLSEGERLRLYSLKTQIPLF